MNIIKYIILSTINSITNLLPISYSCHIFIFQNTFNTVIFNNSTINSLLNLSLLITIILNLRKHFFNYFLSLIKSIFKKNKSQYKKNIKYLNLIFISTLISTVIYLIIPHKIPNIRIVAISYILTSIFLLSSINKNGQKKYSEITYIDSIIIGLSSIFTFIPTISQLCANLFMCARRKLDKRATLSYSFICLIPVLLIKSIPGIKALIINQEYLLISVICLSISIFISLYVFDYFKYLYKQNKLYKLAIYCFVLSIFLLYWFR